MALTAWNMEEQWVKSLTEKLEEIRKLDPKDRLSAAAACTQCVTAIHNTIAAWMQRLTNPALLNDFEEKALKEFFDFYRRFTTEFLAFDVDATSQRKTSGRRPATA
ncbi:MAG: DUF2153 family protein [Candidatus Bathyarchaeia archaeon]